MIERCDFSDLRDLFVNANEEKSGAQVAHIAAETPLAGAIPMYRPSPNGQMPGITMRIFVLANILVVSCLAIERPDKAVSFQYEDYVLTHPLTACGHNPRIETRRLC